MTSSDPFHTKYRELSEGELADIANIKRLATKLYLLLMMAPQGREQALAKTALEECVMWSVKGITK